jgi:Transglutaminase-like superfamily
MAQSRLKLHWKHSILARIAASSAWLLSKLPPIALCTVLTMVVKRTRPADAEKVSYWRSAVNSVSTRCAGNGCLQRSIAVVILARFFGASPTWRTGFRPDPFTAHAWVEVDGLPIDEPAAVSSFHVVLEVIPAH